MSGPAETLLRFVSFYTEWTRVWLLSPFHSSVKSLHIDLCSLGSFILKNIVLWKSVVLLMVTLTAFSLGL